MKSKYLAYFLLRLFSIIYLTIYTLPYVVSGISVFSSGNITRFSSQMIPFYLYMLIVIIIPVATWYGADFVSSRIVDSKDEYENHLHLEAADYLSILTLLLGLIFVVKSLPLIISIIFSKIFFGRSVNLPFSFQGPYKANRGYELIQPIIEFILGDLLMIFNYRISKFLSRLHPGKSMDA